MFIIISINDKIISTVIVIAQSRDDYINNNAKMISIQTLHTFIFRYDEFQNQVRFLFCCKPSDNHSGSSSEASTQEQSEHEQKQVTSS